ncbi:MAG TPA: peptidoglycan DD-metalloendopeptidase family protein [Miltoncostaea sp.]|nr:peptidoglycan DD-metalloendopeptidase family protein [Miltoncostaea sp.]
MGRGRPAAALAFAVGVVIALGLGAGAVAAPEDDKAAVDRRLERAQDRLARQRAREDVLVSEVQAYSTRIRTLERRLGPLRVRAGRLEAEHAALRARLRALTDRLRIERARLAEARAELARRQELLGRRLRELYARGQPDPILVLVTSGSLADAVATSDLLEGIAARDGDLAAGVRRYRDATRRSRDAIAEARADVADSEARAASAAARAQEAKAALETEAAGVDRLLGGRRALLSSVRGDREDIAAEARGLQRRSADLAARIRAAQGPSAAGAAAGGGAPSAQGFTWPTSGTITSGFGPRWGRMHEGIDIAGGSGTPIHAAAAGTVIVAGWSGGYGNLVVIDHGGGISTAYGHNSSLAVTVGQQVSQGQTIDGMGTTGHSTGVHCHFEVRVNGGAVDPMGYL